MVNFLTKSLKPGSTIGIIGGGQLGQMMALSAKEMGFNIVVLDPDERCPASSVANIMIVANYDDPKSMEELATLSDVLTYEFENVDSTVLASFEDKLPQGTELLQVSQNRLLEKEYLSKHDLPIAPYEKVMTEQELKVACQRLGYPCVLKTVTGGYDGKGQVVLNSEQDIVKAVPLLTHGSCVLEAWVPFIKELSVIVSGNETREYRVFPVMENTHRQNILHRTITPARISSSLSETAQHLGLKVAETIGLKGTLTVELFLLEDGQLLVNEIAPRPHNSGHLTIEACNVSQFDLHIRGITNMPLPEITLWSKAVMFNLLGAEQTRSFPVLEEHADWFGHFYGKQEERVGRKMGHITVLSEDIDRVIQVANKTPIWKKEGNN